METSAAAAQCHYQTGRFSQAAAELEKCDEMWTKRCHTLIHDNVQNLQNNEDSNDFDDDIIMADDPVVKKPNKQKQKRCNVQRIELIALPPLARCADIAMCRFRSAISSGVGDKHQDGDNPLPNKEGSNIDSSNIIWINAIESNIIYRQTLRGAAMSLVNTLNNMELQSKSMSQEPQTTQHTNTNKSIQKAMKSTSMAILMAGISASHLYLHHTQPPAQSNCNNMSKKENSWSVLVDAAILAADLMRTRKEWMDKLNNIHDTQPIVNVRKMKLSMLEECICILNETLCTNPSTRNGTNNNKYQAEDERGNIAMHSFTSALKVAALATGKLILPKLSKSSSEENDQPSKRQRMEKEDKPNLKRDAWNNKYLHSSPLLHSRDRLVDAISFHSAAIKHPQSRETFIHKREVCFDEAVMWENQAGALYDADHESGETDDGCARYVWKIRNCLHGMEIVIPFPSHLDEQKKKTRLQSLETLASSSSSQFACDLLGCIYAKKGEYSRALEKFQMSLDHGGKNGSNSDEEIGKCLVEHRTLLNTTLCFLSMGEVDTPLELLLHLWVTISESQPHCAVRVAQPTAILLTTASNEMEGLIDHTPEHTGQTTKLQLLWKLFISSSLAQDWSTCLNTTEEMLAITRCDRRGVKTCTDLARIFALLQCRRSVAAQETTRLLLPKLVTSGNKPKRELVSARLLQVVAELYHADALLMNNEQTTNNNPREGETPFGCTQHALDTLESVCEDVNANFTHDKASLAELHVTTYNDRGITLLMKGDSVGALHCFREAAKHSSTSAFPLPWLSLPTYYNLSLLLLRDGHIEESAKTWLQTRDHFSIWRNAMRGDNDALRQLKNLRVMAINRHGLLMAKRSMQGDATMWDQENILEWTPPVSEERNDVNEDSNRVVGVDASQITALDVVLLRYALSTAEKKASSSFRRSAGHMGY